MGTAEGNRLRPEEHTTGAPVVMRAAMHKSFSALEAGPGGVADPRTGGESPSPFGTNELAGHREPRGPLLSPVSTSGRPLQRIAAKRRALPEPGVPPTGFEPVPPP